MKPSTIAGIFLPLLCVFSVQAGDAEPAQAAGAVVAVIDGAKITDADLKQKFAGRMFQARATYYQTERQILDEFVEEYLLERQANAEKVTVEQLLQNHIDKAIAKDPPEEMLRLYYEVVNPQGPYEEVRPQLLDHLRKIRLAKLKTAYMQSLKSKATVTVGLQAPRVEISLKDAAIRGTAGAPIVLVEYADYECPYCQQVEPALEKVLNEYKGKVAFIFKDMPLNVHVNAAKAAEATRCAQAQGKYWEYHDTLFAKKQFDPANLKVHARDLKLDSAAFDKCLDSGATSASVASQFSEAQTLGLQGTPSFFINGRATYGNLTVEQLRQIIDEELALLKSPRSAQPTNERAAAKQQ